MTFNELEKLMIERGIRRGMLAINEIPKDGQYCIQFDGKTTEVFRFERGIKMDLATFADISAAMTHYQSLVLEDQSAFVHWDGRIR
jgi:hypothetical protein